MLKDFIFTKAPVKMKVEKPLASEGQIHVLHTQTHTNTATYRAQAAAGRAILTAYFERIFAASCLRGPHAAKASLQELRLPFLSRDTKPRCCPKHGAQQRLWPTLGKGHSARFSLGPRCAESMHAAKATAPEASCPASINFLITSPLFSPLYTDTFFFFFPLSFLKVRMLHRSEYLSLCTSTPCRLQSTRSPK